MSVYAEFIKEPKVLYQTHSDFNKFIEVIEVGTTRKMIVGNTIQSVNFDSQRAEKHVWGQLVNIIKANEDHVSRALILGLGGGTMQKLLSNSFPDVEITSVEIDPKVVEIAENYFYVKEIPNHRIINDDAFRVIAEPESFDIPDHYFDVAIIDIFHGTEYPELGRSGQFITGVNRLVRPGGLVMFDQLYGLEHQDAVHHFEHILNEHLLGVKSYTVAGKTNADNIIIYGRVL